MIKAKALKTDMPANDDEWLSAELKAAHKCSELQRLEWRWRCWWRWERAGGGGGAGPRQAERTPGSENSVQTHRDDPPQKAPQIKFLQQESQFGQCVIDFPKGSESTPSDPWDSLACESLLFSQACSHNCMTSSSSTHFYFYV